MVSGLRKFQKMARNNAQGEKQHSGASTASTSASAAIRVRSRPDPFLVVCRCFSIVTSADLCQNSLWIPVKILSGSDVLEYWAARGMLQIYNGSHFLCVPVMWLKRSRENYDNVKFTEHTTVTHARASNGPWKEDGLDLLCRIILKNQRI